MPSVQLDSLQCIIEPTDPGSHVEMYMNVFTDGQLKARIPSSGDHSMEGGDTWSLNDKKFNFDSDFKIYLYEADGGVNNDDFLGMFELPTDQKQNPYEFEKRNDYDFSLAYSYDK